MKTETNDTPRTDEACEAMGLKAFVVPVETSRQLERELAEKTNEVARLMDLLERAIEAIEEEGCPKTANDIREELAPLAPSPEEPVFIPTDLNQQNKENTLALNEWRELGPDERVQDGDEFISETGVWYPVDSTIGHVVCANPKFRFRTRRRDPEAQTNQQPEQ